MISKLTSILLVDDNEDDNLFHEIAIKKFDPGIRVISKELCKDALEFLIAEINIGNPVPDLIFLDINLPMINGWEFLQKFSKLIPKETCKTKIILLTTSDNPDDIQKSKAWDLVVDYYTKPLTCDNMITIAAKHFMEPEVA